MSHETSPKPTEPRQQPAPTIRAKTRFRLEKLEERIAPKGTHLKSKGGESGTTVGSGSSTGSY